MTVWFLVTLGFNSLMGISSHRIAAIGGKYQRQGKEENTNSP
ncbi:MAG: hypothetical protein PVH48_07505 [Cyclobacteriaceae bacterium]